MRFNKDWMQLNWVPYTIATCSAVILYFLLSHLGLYLEWIMKILGPLKPVFLGIILAYLMDPIARFYQKTIFCKIKQGKIQRMLAIVLSILTVLLTITLLLGVLIPQLISSISVLASNFGEYADTLERMMIRFAETTGITLNIETLAKVGGSVISKVYEILSSNAVKIANASTGVGSAMVNLIIGFILAIYLMMDKEKLVSGMKTFAAKILKNRYKKIAGFCYQCDRILLRYISCSILEGCIVGLLNFVFMLICGMPYAALISVVVGLTNLAPTFGPIVGAIIGGFILVLVNPMNALWFLIFTVILQTIDGYIIKPKLFGDSLGVSALWILIAIVVGGQMFGVIGILLAIPAAAILDYLFRIIVLKNQPIA